MDYTELVKSLRICAEIHGECALCLYQGNGCDAMPETPLTKAANAIEGLLAAKEEFKKAYHADYDARIEEIKRHKWISVKERLPEDDTDVLVVRKFLGVKGQVRPSTYVEIASRIGDEWVAVSDEYKISRSKHTNPTHWMPLPEPPKEETE